MALRIASTLNSAILYRFSLVIWQLSPDKLQQPR